MSCLAEWKDVLNGLQNPVARKLKSLLDYCSGRAQITIAASFLYFLYFHPLLELIWVIQFSSFATPSFLIFCFVNTCNYICIYTHIYIYNINIYIYIRIYIIYGKEIKPSFQVLRDSFTFHSLIIIGVTFCIQLMGILYVYMYEAFSRKR